MTDKTTGNDLTAIKMFLFQAGYSWQEEVSQDSLSLTLTKSARSEDDVIIYLTVPMNDRGVGYAIEEMAHLVTAVFPGLALTRTENKTYPISLKVAGEWVSFYWWDAGYMVAEGKGVISQGKTFVEAETNIREAIALRRFREEQDKQSTRGT